MNTHNNLIKYPSSKRCRKSCRNHVSAMSLAKTKGTNKHSADSKKNG